MGLGYNVPDQPGSPAGTMNQLTSNGIPDSFGIFLCPAYPGASGTGPNGAQRGTALGEIEWDTVDNLMNNPLSKASKDSFGWIKVWPQNVPIVVNPSGPTVVTLLPSGPWYAVSLRKVSVTDSHTSVQLSSTNIENLQFPESSYYPQGLFSDYNSIMDSGTGVLPLYLLTTAVMRVGGRRARLLASRRLPRCGLCPQVVEFGSIRRSHIGPRKAVC